MAKPAPTLPYPPVFELNGDSMEPSLMRGWRVRVEPLEGDPEPGDLALLQTRSGFVLHRVVHRATLRDGTWVFHRGDCGTSIGIVRADAVLGRVTLILTPPGRPLPTLGSLSPRRRRGFEAARKRSHVWATARGLALRFGLLGTPLTRLAGPLLRRFLR